MTLSFHLSSLDAQIDTVESELLEVQRMEDYLLLLSRDDAYAARYPAAMAQLEQLHQSIYRRKQWLEETVQILQSTLNHVSDYTEEATNLLHWFSE